MNFKNTLLIVIFSIFSIHASAESVWDKSSQSLTAPTEIVVYRSPSCGCCHKWIEHLKKHQFKVKDMVTQDVNAIKQKYGVSGEMASCHTAIVDGYVVEGHVPASDIVSLLTARPKIVGISVPAMPVGTPGMEMSARKDLFKVIAFDNSGKYSEFNSYESY
jgi:hypothetical protein